MFSNLIKLDDELGRENNKKYRFGKKTQRPIDEIKNSLIE